jgi:hypothetical protein
MKNSKMITEKSLHEQKMLILKHIFVYDQQYHDVRQAEWVRLQVWYLQSLTYDLIVLNIVFKLKSFLQ